MYNDSLYAISKSNQHEIFLRCKKNTKSELINILYRFKRVKELVFGLSNVVQRKVFISNRTTTNRITVLFVWTYKAAKVFTPDRNARVPVYYACEMKTSRL